MNDLADGADLRALVRGWKSRGETVGFVPTMGALHAGHLSLVERARAENDRVVVSIFVNPTQFSPGEDFEKYPRTLAHDRATLIPLAPDALFTPTAQALYPEGFSTYVDPGPLGDALCGPFRPGHFRGVATVVLKLLHLVEPDRLYLGRKDGQQLRIIEKLAADLDLPVAVIGCPTLREADGLAMSSRNAYLAPAERALAPELYRALAAVAAAFHGGESTTEILENVARERLGRVPGFELQYAEIRAWRDFSRPARVEELSILATALYIGTTRLIDNVLLDPAERPR